MSTGFLAVLLLLLTATILSAGDATPPATVLAELFTSEGCSSCPPADKLLEKLDTAHPVPGVQIVVLSEHVDYWDQLGWKDRFSSAAFTARQETYGRRFRVESVYTPQMVIDGREQVLGSDAKAVQAAISRAATNVRLLLTITGARLESGTARFRLEVPVVSKSADYDRAEVWIAIAEERSASDVGKGENAGRQLTHIAVARRLTKVGEVTKRRGFSQDLRLPAGAGPSRIIALVQLPDTGPIAGVGMAKF